MAIAALNCYIVTPTRTQRIAERSWEKPNEPLQNVIPVVICGPCVVTSNLKLLSSKSALSAR
jgi:hypothetical protein